MKRDIVGFAQDELDDWFAWLDCGHRQHTRHNPPLETRPWVETESGRSDMIGQTLDCVRCDQFEMPDDFECYRTVEFTDLTVPAGLLKDHTTKRGVWGKVIVTKGSLRYVVDSHAVDEELLVGEEGIIVPELPHRVSPATGTTFQVAFYRAVRAGSDNATAGSTP